MKAKDLHDHMLEIGTWVDWGRGVDGFKIGDPEADVTGIAVAWIALAETVESAHRAGCNLFVTHEDPFYSNIRPDPAAHERTAAQRRFIEENGIIIYRCHDVWDVMPEIGIVDSWAKGLGLEGKPVAEQKYYAVYDIGRMTFRQLARRILERVKPLGQKVVLTVGDPGQAVSRLAIGTGAITDPFLMHSMGADVLLVTDDPFQTTAKGGWCRNMGLPVMIVSHATAEEWGVANLARYLRQQFPEVPVEHFPQGCFYDVVM